MALNAHPDVELINAKFSFADNPIIVKSKDLSFNDGSIFRQFVIEVTTYYDSSESKARTFIFSVNADGGEDVLKCDISSAIRSTFAAYEYSTELTEGKFVYPNVGYEIKVCAKEMSDGVVRTSNFVTASSTDPDTNTSTTIFQAYLGGLSERERWLSDSVVNIEAIPTKFSTKPTSGEFVGTGHFYTSTSINQGRVTTSITAMAGPSIDPRKGVDILFVNSRGVHETISVMATESEEYEINTEVRNLVGATAYRPSPSIITHKEGGGAVWKMSSGWVNKDWAQWYAREFLMAKHYWIYKDDRWLPVSIIPDSDSVVVYDKNDPSLLAVNFAVRSAIKG